MTTIKHTPGPWRVDPAYRYEVLTADNRFRILLTTQGSGAYGEEWAANARLIAAAPEMRALLEVAAHPHAPGLAQLAQQLLARIDGAEVAS